MVSTVIARLSPGQEDIVRKRHGSQEFRNGIVQTCSSITGGVICSLAGIYDLICGQIFLRID